MPNLTTARYAPGNPDKNDLGSGGIGPIWGRYGGWNFALGHTLASFLSYLRHRKYRFLPRHSENLNKIAVSVTQEKFVQSWYPKLRLRMPNFIEIKETVCGRTDVQTRRTYGHSRPTHFIRSTQKSRPNNMENAHVAEPFNINTIYISHWEIFTHIFVSSHASSVHICGNQWVPMGSMGMRIRISLRKGIGINVTGMLVAFSHWHSHSSASSCGLSNGGPCHSYESAPSCRFYTQW